MKHHFYLYAESALQNIIREIFINVEITPVRLEKLNNNNFKNNNVLLVSKTDIYKKINESFFFNNNVVIFSSKKNNINHAAKLNNSVFIYGHRGVEKFSDEIKSSFLSNSYVYKNIQIFNEEISNIKNNISLTLTPLEKEILIFLFENQKTKKQDLLEIVLKTKKEIQTKTIESHLTRIRKKLSNIKSKIQIFLKDDYIYLDD